MKRRSFLLGAAALFAAPAIVKAENLMKMAVPKFYLFGDGIHDDTLSLQYLIRGGDVYDFRTGKKIIHPGAKSRLVPSGTYRITDTLNLDIPNFSLDCNRSIFNCESLDKPAIHISVNDVELRDSHFVYPESFFKKQVKPSSLFRISNPCQSRTQQLF